MLYEDDEIIAVSKPAGMVVHPAPGSWNGTFVNALVYHLEKTAGGSMGSAGFQSKVDAPDGEHNTNLRPGIVHRLDKGTTGVLLAAKNPTMQAKLGELFAERRVRLKNDFLARDGRHIYFCFYATFFLRSLEGGEGGMIPTKTKVKSCLSLF